MHRNTINSTINQSTTNGIGYNSTTGTQVEVFPYLYTDLKPDTPIDSWLFISSPWPVFIILAVYLTFIYNFGPKLMKNREPFNIKYIMLMYNLMQIVFNSYILSFFVATPGMPSYLVNHGCHPDTTGAKSHITFEIHRAGWFFSVSKIIDLLDTVFMVLKKKQSHISFLHVYHHVNMVITCFFHLMFIKSENYAVGTILNSFVHTIMYSYYFLSALGPGVQKHLWWKKYLTRIQIIQFLIGILYIAGLMTCDCTYSKLFYVYVLADTLLFLYMFTRFYRKTYKSKNKTQ